MITKFANLFAALIIVAAWFGTVNAESTDDATLTKGNARYMVKPEYSRFLLFFKGQLRYSEELQGNTVIVKVADIQSAITLNGSNLQFQHGLVERAIVDKIVNGQTTIRLTLREGYKGYQVFSHDRHQAIWIDVLPKNMKLAVVSQTSVKAANKNARQIAFRKPTNKSAIVDIPALIKEQLANDKGDGISAERPVSSSNHQENGGSLKGQAQGNSGAGPTLFLFISSLALIIAGVLGMVFLAKRRNRRVVSPEHEFEQKEISVTLPLFPDYIPPVTNVPEKKSSSIPFHELSNEQDEEPNGTRQEELVISLAKQYRRNQGDVEFAVKMRQNSREGQPATKVVNTPSRLVINSSRSVAARKLGIGTGELELSERLKQMESRQEKEELA